MENIVDFGVLALLPTICLFVLVLITKRVLLALLCAGILGSIMLGGWDFASVWAGQVQGALQSDFLSWLFLVMSLFGIYIVMMEKSGAAREFAGWLSKYANTRRKALFLTEALGVIIFIDDALNNVAVGTSMKKLTDSHRVPRSLLGYVTISTSAPVCILLPISTWALTNGGLMMDAGVSVNNSPVDTFAGTIPFMFFGWVTLIILSLVNAGWMPKLGVIKKDQKLADATGIVISKEASRDGKELKAELFEELRNSNEKFNPFKFLIPLGVLILVTILADNNVIIGCSASILVSGLLMKVWGKTKVTEILSCGVDGIKSMIFLLVQMALATTLMLTNTEIGMPTWVQETVTPHLTGAILPFLVFIVFTAYSSFGGGFWEMSMLFMPIVIPIALQLGANPFVSAAALVSASAAGSSLFVCGDTVALVSSVVGIKPTRQAAGTFPYAMISVAISAVLFLIVGLLGI